MALYKWDKARLQTSSDLKDYILRKLGSPVINIEITSDQLDDCVYDTLKLYFQYAYSGVVERYIPVEIKKGVSQYSLSYDVFAVLDIQSTLLGGIANSAPSNIFSLNQYVAADLYRGTGKIDLLTYEMTNQMLATLDLEFSKKMTFDYDCVNRKLNLFETPNVDEIVMMHVYKMNVPEYITNDDDTITESTNIYDELWVKRYALETARYQWATNLSKYNGTSLPGGLVLDVPTILTESKENIEKLTLQLEEEYRLPIDMMVGILTWFMISVSIFHSII